MREAICIHVGQAGLRSHGSLTRKLTFASIYNAVATCQYGCQFALFSFRQQPPRHSFDLSLSGRIEVSRSVTPAGSSSASSTVSSPMARCPPTRLSVVVMTLSTPSSPRPVPASTCPVPSSSISSPPSLMRSALVGSSHWNFWQARCHTEWVKKSSISSMVGGLLLIVFYQHDEAPTVSSSTPSS